MLFLIEVRGFHNLNFAYESTNDSLYYLSEMARPVIHIPEMEAAQEFRRANGSSASAMNNLKLDYYPPESRTALLLLEKWRPVRLPLAAWFAALPLPPILSTRRYVQGLFLAVAVWVTIACASLEAQTTQGSYTVEGTARNSVTGAAVPHALVGLASENFSDLRIAESSGGFRFTGVPAGQYHLSASKPGYFDPDTDSEDLENALHVSSDMRGLTLKLVPESVIWGRVEDSDHEGLARAYVSVNTYVGRNGKRTLERKADTRTDADGNFRIANLAAGDYLIGLATNFEPAAASGNAGGEQDWGYAPTYYPGVDDVASAAKVHVDSGQRTQIRFTVASRPVYHVSGKVTENPLTEPATVWFERAEVPQLGMRFSSNPVTGEFMARYVAAGNYVVHVVLQNAGQEWIGEQMLNINSDVHGVAVRLSAGVTIPVTVRLQPSGSNTPASPLDGRFPYLALSLSPEGWWRRSARGAVQAKTGELSGNIEHVFPGRYSVQVSSGLGWYVAELRSGDLDLLREKLTVVAGMTPGAIEAVLRDDSGILSVSLPKESATAPFHVVALSRSAPTRSPFTGMSHEGVAEIDNLPPGEYDVLALDRLDDVPYAEPDFLLQYASRAVHAEVHPREKVSLEVQLIRMQP